MKTETTKSRSCIIVNCDNAIKERSELSICELCRQTLYRWSYRKPAEVLERRRKLTMYGDRMIHVDGGKRR